MESGEPTSKSWTGQAAGRVPRLGHLIEAWGEAMEEALQEDIFQYDPEFTERVVNLMEVYGRYFDSEVRGTDRLPESGPVLVVGNLLDDFRQRSFLAPRKAVVGERDLQGIFNRPVRHKLQSCMEWRIS